MLPLQFLNSSYCDFQILGVFQCAFSCFQLSCFLLPRYFCLAPSGTSCFCATISLPTMPVFSDKNANLSLAFFSPCFVPLTDREDQSLHKQQWFFSLTHKTLTPEIHLLKALGHDYIPFPFQFLGFHLHGLWVRPSRTEEGTTDDVNLARCWDCKQREAEAMGPDQLFESHHCSRKITKLATQPAKNCCIRSLSLKPTAGNGFSYSRCTWVCNHPCKTPKGRPHKEEL